MKVKGVIGVLPLVTVIPNDKLFRLVPEARLNGSVVILVIVSLTSLVPHTPELGCALAYKVMSPTPRLKIFTNRKGINKTMMVFFPITGIFLYSILTTKTLCFKDN